MVVFRCEDYRRGSITVLAIRIGATFKQVFRYLRSSRNLGKMKNISVIRTKPGTRFKQNVIDCNHSFFCLGGYSRIDTNQLLHPDRFKNTPTAAAAVTIVGVGATSNSAAYGARVEIIDSRFKLPLTEAKF